MQEFRSRFGDIFGSKIMVNAPTTKLDCRGVFGEYYVFLSCMGLCLDSTCPLNFQDTPLYHDSCPGQYPDRVSTLANNSHLTFVTMSDGGDYENAYFQCKNRRCVEFSQVCDLIDDCGDLSDEEYCGNHVMCNDTGNLIAHSQQCDGIFDCFDMSDECNQECSKEIITNWFLKIYCWVLGILAIFCNALTVVKVAISLGESRTGSLLYTRVLVCIIGLGDFLIGVYLIALSVFDRFTHGKDYCRKQVEWLSGNACSTLGVISTTGSQLSLFAMTVLSSMRVWGIVKSSSTLKIPSKVNKRAIAKAVLIGIGVIGASLVVALTPLVPAFEDYFVQGMFYDPKYKLFIGFPNKVKHVKILRAYYNNESISADASWAEIGNMVDRMFNQSYGSLTKSPVHFYGNDGVCLFKYFVRSDDPRRSRQLLATEENITDQKGNAMVWVMLCINLFCFILITVSYVIINVTAAKSSKGSGQTSSPEATQKNRKMRNRIALIIATDFACWVPFIVISALHNLGAIDATSWYLTFAMLVLPLNSVINPLLYDNTVKESVNSIIRKSTHRFSKSSQNMRSIRTSSTKISTVEMSEAGGERSKSGDKLKARPQVAPSRNSVKVSRTGN